MKLITAADSLGESKRKLGYVMIPRVFIPYINDLTLNDQEDNQMAPLNEEVYDEKMIKLLWTLIKGVPENTKMLRSLRP